MAQYTLRVRRHKPETDERGPAGPYWEDFEVELDPTLSVLDGLLQAKDRQDGSLGVRCSCRAAICGSCGVKINGQSTLACKTQLGEAQAYADRSLTAAGSAAPGPGSFDRTGAEQPTSPGEQQVDPRAPEGAGQPAGRAAEGAAGAQPIVVEPMGNMPVIKDLVTDMESTHWEKIRRVTPWLLDDGDPPERERVVEHEAMVDITQTISCIQCGACVSACLSMEADPDFIGPAALAKAYRFVGDPRDVQARERLYDLAQDPHGIYDCTHCFSCIDACPKGVEPMNQIMRLRRLATHDHGIDDRNNGFRHEDAFTKIIRKKGTLDESLLLQESFAPGVKGKLMPRLAAIKGLVESVPTAIRGIRTGKMRSLPKLIPGIHPKLPDGAQDHVERLYEHAEEHRTQLNLYITGTDEEVPGEAVEPQPDEREAAT